MISSGVFRLGRDAEIRYTNSGDAVCGLAVAYNYGRKGQDGKQPSQWLECSLWGKQAEALAPYLLKGRQVGLAIEDIHVETYAKKDGGEGIKLVGRVLKVDLVGNRDAGEAPQQAPKPAAKPSSKPQPAVAFADFEDDVPFD